jgi:thiol-disulfide isomerase/thioredoxin
MMQEIKTMEEFYNAKSRKTIFVFTANWCPDCSVIKPLMPMIEAKYSKYEWYYVNRDYFPQLGLELNIFGIPSFIAFDHNNEIGRFVSKLRKSKAEIEQFVEGLSVGDSYE